MAEIMPQVLTDGSPVQRMLHQRRKAQGYLSSSYAHTVNTNNDSNRKVIIHMLVVKRGGCHTHACG